MLLLGQFAFAVPQQRLDVARVHDEIGDRLRGLGGVLGQAGERPFLHGKVGLDDAVLGLKIPHVAVENEDRLLPLVADGFQRGDLAVLLP